MFTPACRRGCDHPSNGRYQVEHPCCFVVEVLAFVVHLRQQAVDAESPGRAPRVGTSAPRRTRPFERLTDAVVTAVPKSDSGDVAFVSHADSLNVDDSVRFVEPVNAEVPVTDGVRLSNTKSSADTACKVAEMSTQRGVQHALHSHSAQGMRQRESFH